MTSARIAATVPPSFSLDLDLPMSGITALFGPPGSGKSLALTSIAGFARPHSGRILLDDVILFDAESKVNVPPRRRNIAWIGPDDTLFPHMSLEQNLKFAARRFPRLERHRRVAEMLEHFQLAPKAFPRDLAGPQKLHGAVARALAGAPKLLLIDDCGMDEALIRRIRVLTDSPIVLVTGDLDLCCAMAGTLVLMDAGRAVQRGTPREVLDRPESVDAARILGVHNLLQGTIATLDPGRNTSRLDFGRFSLNGPYIKGHFRGDQIWVAIDPRDIRVRVGEAEAGLNAIQALLIAASERAHGVRLEFEGGFAVELTREEYARGRDNKSWQLEFPPEVLKVLS